MRTSKCVLFLAICLLSLALFVAPAGAQTGNTGALTVTVTDPSGAVIAGASVTVSNTSGLSRTLTTESNGSITFTLLPPTDYKVTISAEGFKTSEIPSVAVNVAETHVLEQPMQVGAQQEQVTVSTTVQTVQTETSTLGGVVGNAAIVSLPMITRNVTQIVSLSPGVVTDVYNAATLGRGGLDFAVNGQSQSSNNLLVDGVSVNNLATGQNTNPEGFYGDVVYPSADAIQEFKVQTSMFDASYGRQAGGSVNVVTKSGTNDIHGSLFEFLRNTDLNANGFFQNRAGLSRGVLKQNQFGATVGGPIKKDKLFFFISYQGTRQLNGVASQGFQTSSVPPQLTNVRTAAALGAEFCPGNFPTGTPGATYTLTSPANPTVNPQNLPPDQVLCDGSNINPVALTFLNAKLPNGQFIVPSPQIILNPGLASAVGSVSLSIPASFNEDQAIGNVDYLISPKNTVSVKYIYDYGLQNRSFNCSPCVNGSASQNNSGDDLYAAKLTTLVTNSIVNEARFGYYFIKASVVSLDPLTHASLGIQNFTLNHWTDVGPTVGVTGLFSQGSAGTDGAKSPQWDYEWSDQLSWTRGRHTIRVGYDQIAFFWPLNYYGGSRGGVTFSSFPDLLLGESGAQNGTILSNIASTAGYITKVGGDATRLRENDPSLYAQDDIKVNQRLTLNLGLRWEYFGTAYDTLPGNAGFDNFWSLALTVPVPPPSGTFAGYTVANNYTGTVPTGILRRGTNVQTQNGAPKNNFAPRIGFAWQPFGSGGKFVVRGGAGIFYSEVQLNNMVNTFLYNPPAVVPEIYSGTAAVNATWSTPWIATQSLGFPTFLRTPTSVPLASAMTIDQFLKTPEVISYNLNIQYEFKPTWVAEIAFVGARGERLWAQEPLDIPSLVAPGVNGINNTPSPQFGVNCANLQTNGGTGCIMTNTAGNTTQRLPVLGYVVDGINNLCNCADSEYSSLQATIRKTFSHGLQFQASYTFGRTFDDLVGLERGGSVNSNDPNDRSQMWGQADFNRPQRLVMSYSYSAPNYHNAEGFAGRALSGWGLSGVTTIQSGEPMTLTDAQGGGVYGKAGSSRAQLCPGMTYANVENTGSVESRLTGFFNLSSLADTSATAKLAACLIPNPVPINPITNLPNPASGIPVVGAFVTTVNGATVYSTGATGYGNTGRSILLGPAQFNWDMSLTKKTRVGGINENANLEFRAEFFNAFNISQFSNPGAAVSTSNTTFGVIGSQAVASRIIQFALKYVF